MSRALSDILREFRPDSKTTVSSVLSFGVRDEFCPGPLLLVEAFGGGLIFLFDKEVGIFDPEGPGEGPGEGLRLVCTETGGGG